MDSCKGCVKTAELFEPVRKAPRRFQNNDGRITQIHQHSRDICQEKKQFKSSLKNQESINPELNQAEKLYVKNTHIALDSAGGCSLSDEMKTMADKMNEMEKKLNDTYALTQELKKERDDIKNTLAKYDIVYTFIRDLKRITHNPNEKIENLKTQNYYPNNEGAQQLLARIKSRFTETENGESYINQFLEITKRISKERCPLAHLSNDDTKSKYDYNTLQKLCDEDERKVLDIVKDNAIYFGLNAKWPLHRPLTTD